MSGIGQRAYGNQTGKPLHVSADGFPTRKVGGLTINWADANVPVAGAGGVTLADGTFVPAGVRYLRYGQVMVVPIDGDGKQGLAVPAVAATAMVRDRTFVLDESVVETEPMSDHGGGAFYGGRVYKARLNVGGAWPTLANLLVACPLLELVED